MKTPKEYTDALKRGETTEAMIEDVLYSYSKRAKNYRDRIRSIRDKARTNHYWYDRYDDEGRCKEQKARLYGKKGDILAVCQKNLAVIHKLTTWRKCRVYDYQSEWDKLADERRKYEEDKPSKVVWMNSFYDREQQMYVDFCDVRKPVSRYFLYYEFKNRSFHSPIEADDLKKYPELEVVELEELTTYGEDINDLLSLQFCDKVWTLLTGKTANDTEREASQRQEKEQKRMEALMKEALRKNQAELDADPELKAELEGRAKPW